MSQKFLLDEWLAEHEFFISKCELNGRFYRCKYRSRSNADGFFVGSTLGQDRAQQDVIVVTIGSFKTGEKYVFKSYNCESKFFKKKASEKLQQLKSLMNKEKLALQEEAARKANSIFEKADKSGEHKYLKTKKLNQLFGCRLMHECWKGVGKKVLIVPMCDESEKIVGSQKIYEDGSKKFIYGQRTKGAFHIIGNLAGHKNIFLGEGFATMATISMITGEPCVVAFNANNLKEVGLAIAEKYPLADITFVGDDDRFTKLPDGTPKNTGREKATEAVELVGGHLVLPKFLRDVEGQTDFNDLYVAEGADVAKEQLKSLGRKYPPSRFEVVTGGRQARDVIEDIRRAIRHRNRPPLLFKRDNSLVQLSKLDEEFKIKSLSLNETHGLLIREINWIEKKKLKGEDKISTINVKPDKQLYSNDYLALIDEKLPSLRSVISVPIVGKSGKLIVEQGYHCKDEIFADSSGLFGKIDFNKKPDANDLDNAREFLIGEIFCDFPFLDRGSLAHSLAMLFQSFVRPIILGPTPMYLICADSPNAGKTLIANAISIIVDGGLPTIRSFSHKEEEMRKSITATLLNDPKIVVFDNVMPSRREKNICSNQLAALLTSQKWEDRVLGFSKMTVVPNESVWVMTTNRPVLSEELDRRSVVISLKNKRNNPLEKPNFRHQNLTRWIQENRIEIVSNVLTILSGWMNEGRPRSSKWLDSFSDWAALVGGILEFAGIDGFLEKGSRPKRNIFDDDFEKLFEVWKKEKSGQPLRPKDINAICETNSLLEEERGGVSQKSQETRMGNFLSRMSANKDSNLELAFDRGHKGKFYRIKESSDEGTGEPF